VRIWDDASVERDFAVARNLAVSGAVTVAGGTTMSGALQVNNSATLTGDTRFGCRAGFWAVADGRLCVEATLRGPATAHTAIGTCKGVGPGSRVCRHTDLQQACGAGLNPYGATNGWYGDHARLETAGNTDDEFLTWNVNGCSDNNDGPAFNFDASLNFRCCY
jgi:hypothetical protein